MDKLNVNFESNTGGKSRNQVNQYIRGCCEKNRIYNKQRCQQFAVTGLYCQNPGMYVVNVIVNGVSIDSKKIIKKISHSVPVVNK